jgi:hypothetical protein
VRTRLRRECPPKCESEGHERQRWEARQSDQMNAHSPRQLAASVTETFFELERDLGLFEQQVQGVRFWERIRFNVHRRLLRAMGLIGQPHAKA